MLPTSRMSLATSRPPGFKPAAHGVFLKIFGTSKTIAGACSATWDEPSEAAMRPLGSLDKLFHLASIANLFPQPSLVSPGEIQPPFAFASAVAISLRRNDFM